MLFDGNKVKTARKPGKKQKENHVGKSGAMLFDDNKIKTARKPGKKQKENPEKVKDEKQI